VVVQDLGELKEKRRALRPLLSPSNPADALASYYGLWHDPRRTQLTLHHDDQQRADGFVVVAQTGADLFRPLVTLHAPTQEVGQALLRSALQPGRPYQILVPVMLAAAVREEIEITRSSLGHIYSLDPGRFQSVINVLVQRVDTEEGGLRFQIESQGQVMAMAGTNWRSPTFAEIFVYVHPRGRGRGWGRSVVSACTAALLDQRVRPLYTAEEENQASIGIATSLGYMDSGLRQFVAEGYRK
jgi:GNAT superfamily N-acetyltransferase